MRFWDSSAVAALCVDESRTPAMERLVREDPGMVVWWATPSSVLPRSLGAGGRARYPRLTSSRPSKWWII
jgi:hypothetical protein